MAITKNTTASGTYIVTTGSTTVTYQAPGTRAEVLTNVIPITYSTGSFTVPTGAGLIPPGQVTKPGVFTAGTAPEGTRSNPTNDSNG